LSISRKAALYFARKEYCRKTIVEKADLSAFREKLTFTVKIGIVLVFFSYIIGLPAVAAMGALAAIFKEPMIFVIGGPVIYGISTIIFILGIHLAGKKYIKVFFRWSVRTVLEKILGNEINKIHEVVNEQK